jgi:putative component of membrane protein insertase Oxa1/YidC/SpoIIIJ protein YidD
MKPYILNTLHLHNFLLGETYRTHVRIEKCTCFNKKGNPLPGGITGPPCHWGT